MTGQTLADWAAAHILALCPAAADALSAGVGAAAGAAVRAAHITAAARANRSLSAPELAQHLFSTVYNQTVN